MTGAEALARGVAALGDAGIDEPARDARRLLAHALGLAPGRLTLVLPDPVPDVTVAVFDQLIARRAARAPVSHLIGRRAFFGRDFIVTPDVLDPRPETETLIAAALERPFERLLDLGTGSGCILLTLLAERPGATGLGTDLSPAALSVARRNADALHLTDRAGFAEGGWYAAVAAGARFDLIVSNPPYIAPEELPGLAPELAHEPRMALTDEADGLTAYRAIARGAADHLAPQGRLIVEIGHRQGAAVSAILAEHGLTGITVRHDLDGRDRVVTGDMVPQTDGNRPASGVF